MKAQIIGLLLLGVTSCQTVETEYFLLPQGFTGRAEVIFDQKNGTPIKYEGKTRIYEIPSNGILLTQFHYDAGWINHHFFYVDKRNVRTELPIFKYEYNKDGTTKYNVENKDKIGIMGDGTTGQAFANSSAQFESFFVSSVNGLDSMESFDHYNKRIEQVSGRK